ncbi:MAG: SDR family oxidoreductase, partial [Pseudomonadota bacterium]
GLLVVQDIRHRGFGSPDDIAASAVYLASNEARYMTGQTLHVNGGMLMQ